MKFCWPHDWNDWQQYTCDIPMQKISAGWWLRGAVEHRQKRTCKCCGKVQDNVIRAEIV